MAEDTTQVVPPVVDTPVEAPVDAPVVAPEAASVVPETTPVSPEFKTEVVVIDGVEFVKFTAGASVVLIQL